ncbi:MAG: VOC family protein [Bacteroidales bacterium]|nr:VOC family protein [Bacteroidales bacterium]
MDLKADRKKLEEDGLYTGTAREMIARRFGRLLSYTPRTINNQLTLHTDFRTMYNFGIQAINVSFYYRDLEKAKSFYSKILGLDIVEDNGNSVIVKMANDSFLTLVDARAGMPYSDKPKTVALALVTDQIAEWSAYLKDQDVEIKHDYMPAGGKAHNSMVVVDPEGYLLEFERFNQHPENEKFFSMLKQNKVIHPDTQMGEKLSINSSITWLYYKNLLPMQNFYQDVLGLELIVDQGWTKIYKSSETGFIGLVDEKRGMHKFSREKAVNVSFVLKDAEGWFEYVKKKNLLKVHSDTPFIGVDPGGYHMRFLSR